MRVQLFLVPVVSEKSAGVNKAQVNVAEFVLFTCNNSNNETWLLAMYYKSERESIPAHELRKIRDAIHDRKNE